MDRWQKNRNITVFLSNYHMCDYNFRLVIWIFFLGIISVTAIDQVSGSFSGRQCGGYVAAFGLIIIFSLISYNFIAKRFEILYIINIGILSILLVAGTRVNGSVRWLSLGSFGSIQPSEFSKIVMIIFMASFFGKEHLRIRQLKFVIASACLYLIPLILILLEPDLSTSLVLVCIFAAMLFYAGLGRKTILVSLAVMIPLGSGLVWYILQPGQKLLLEYQRQRILTFLSPDAHINNGYAQQYHALIAIGSGKFSGQHFNNSDAAAIINGNYISEPQTDFIFAVIGEHFGFAGCFITIMLIFAVTAECFYIAGHAPDRTGYLIACGTGTWVGIQALINLGVALGILPNTGLPLPFVSYGLSSLMSLSIAAGIVLNIGLQKNRRL